jgi:hypothetical protein
VVKKRNSVASEFSCCHNLNSASFQTYASDAAGAFADDTWQEMCGAAYAAVTIDAEAKAAAEFETYG